MKNQRVSLEVDPAKQPEEVGKTIGSGCPPLNLQRVLVPVDFSGCSAKAVDYAIAFAAQFQASITFLHVIEPAPGYGHNSSFNAGMDEAHQAQIAESYERLTNVYSKRLGPRHSAETLVRIGRAHSEICDTAKALGADLIVMGTHGAAGRKPVSVGSTAERVVRHASCPVLTVRDGIGTPFGV